MVLPDCLFIIYSNGTDICVPGRTTVKKYQEDDLDQADIDDEEFFCRYTLEWKIRKVNVRLG
jgi:hypothetical protein